MGYIWNYLYSMSFYNYAKVEFRLRSWNSNSYEDFGVVIVRIDGVECLVMLIELYMGS